jgi:phosphoenolpyruvate synthase/pyruvate phosphate dikinase
MEGKGRKCYKKTRIHDITKSKKKPKRVNKTKGIAKSQIQTLPSINIGSYRIIHKKTENPPITREQRKRRKLIPNKIFLGLVLETTL